MKVRFFFLWVIVGVPLVWGLTKTVQNALKLFQ
jgi:hypothetical protein